VPVQLGGSGSLTGWPILVFTYSITNGIGAGFLAYVVIKTVLGGAREVHWLLWGASALFLVHFAIDPVEQLLGVR